MENVDNALIQMPEIPTGLEKFDDASLAAATKSGTYLARLQLLTSNSDKVKGGEFQVNHYALVQDQNFIDLGKSVDVLVISIRPKAIEMGDEVIACYDPKPDENDQATGEFKRIMDRAADEGFDSGCMFGVEFLLWIPSKHVFAGFFMGTPSARRESPALKARIRMAATLESKKIETKKFTWWAPRVLPCSTPFDMPDDAAMLREADKFINVPDVEIETVKESTNGSERER